MSWRGVFLLGFFLACRLSVAAQMEGIWSEPGPPSTRDLFPLNLVALTYRPVGANTIGMGEWRVSILVNRSNTFEFSDLIKDRLGRDTSGRISVDQAGMASFASSFPNEPLIFFFDAEIQRTEFSFRYGVAADTDLALTLGWQSIGGGFLDRIIEGFHKLGFEQTGRSAITQNQFTMAVIQKGQLVYFTQTPVRARPVDPVMAIIHRFYEDPKLTVSFLGALQVPATETQSGFHSNWDSSADLIFEWRPAHNQIFNGGLAYLRRGVRGGIGVSPFLIKDQIAGHLGWEWRGWPRVRPFLVLVYHDALTTQSPGATLDRPSVVHDMGIHVRLNPRTTLSLSYINNVTHNENTADMGLSLRLAMHP